MTTLARGRSLVESLAPLVYAAYVRQSKDETGERLGVRRQVEDIQAWALRAGVALRWFEDNGVSATSRKPRPQYGAMLEAIRAGAVQGVVVWNLDRLHRRPIELEEFIALADRMGLRLATISGDVDLSTDSGRLHARIMGAVARAEMERKMARQSRFHRQRVDEGRPFTPRRAFGFEADGVTQRPDEAAAVRAAFAAVLAGESMSGVAAAWTARGFRTAGATKAERAAAAREGRDPAPGEWTKAGVRQVLTNPRYAGLCRWRGKDERGQLAERVTKATWLPVTDPETFDAVQAIFANRAGRGDTRTRRYLLSGLARCSVCGSTVSGSTGGGKMQYRKNIYRCPSSHTSVLAADAEGLVVDAIEERLAQPDAPNLLLDDSADNAAELRRTVAALEASMARLAEERDDPELGLSDVEYRRRRVALNEKLAAARAGQEHASREPLLGGLVRGDEAWGELSLDRRRAVVGMMLPELRFLPRAWGAAFNYDPELGPVHVELGAWGC